MVNVEIFPISKRILLDLCYDLTIALLLFDLFILFFWAFFVLHIFFLHHFHLFILLSSFSIFPDFQSFLSFLYNTDTPIHPSWFFSRLAYDHIPLKISVLLRAPKLNNVEHDQYLDGWPHENTKCCQHGFDPGVIDKGSELEIGEIRFRLIFLYLIMRK